MGWQAETADPAVKELVFPRIIQAPREHVFEAWTHCEQLLRWFHPEGHSVSRCEVEPREGGSFHITVTAPDGTDRHTHGTFRELRAPERLVFSSGDGANEDENTVTLEPLGERTGLTLTTRVPRARPGMDAWVKDRVQVWNETLHQLADAFVYQHS